MLPGVVSAVRLDEVHAAVLGQEGHQLFVGPEERRQLSIIQLTSQNGWCDIRAAESDQSGPPPRPPHTPWAYMERLKPGSRAAIGP